MSKSPEYGSIFTDSARVKLSGRDPEFHKFTAKWLYYWKGVTATLTLMTIVRFVIAVELTLRWNAVANVYDVASTGQLIPFVIGLLGLLRALHLTAISAKEEVGQSLHNLIISFRLTVRRVM